MSKSENILNVCLLGSPAAGKTCFIGGLAILGEPDRNSPFTIMSKGSCHQYLRELGKTLRSRAWPPATNVTQRIEAAIQFKGGDLHLTLLDYPGGHYKDLLASLDKSVIRELEQTYQEADVFLMLMDPVLDILSHDGMSPKFREQLIERQTAHIQSAMHSFRREGGEKERPNCLGLVITKSDKHPELSSPSSARKFVETHAPNLLDRLDMVLGAKGRAKVFAVSAIGNSPDASENPLPPKVIDPSGYEELFDWLHRLQWWKKWGRAVRKAVMAVAFAAVVLLAFFSWVGIDNFLYRDEMTSNRKSALEKLAISAPQFPLFVNPAELRLGVAKGEVGRIQEKIRDSIDLSQLEELEGLVKKITESRPPMIGDFERLTEEINKKQERLLFTMIVSEQKSNPRICLECCTKYMIKFPGGENAENVKVIQNSILKSEKENDALAIRQIVCSNALNMVTKAALIDAYLKKHGSNDAEAMKLAIGMARQLAVRHKYTLNTKSFIGFQDNYNIFATYTLNGDLIHKIKSLKNGNGFRWPNDNCIINWVVGDPIALEVVDDGYFIDAKIAELPPDKFDSLLRLMDPIPLTPTLGYPKEIAIMIDVDITAPDGATITLQRHKAFRDYIHPGKTWDDLEAK